MEGLRKQSIKPHLKPTKAEVMRKICGKYAIAIGAEERRKFRGRSAEAKKSVIIHHRGGSKAEGMRKLGGSYLLHHEKCGSSNLKSIIYSYI